MRERDPFQVALECLLAAVGSGRCGWGEPLVVTALAAQLGLSPTPVREALARLSGEGLIEHRPGRGYWTPRPTAQDIAGLYRLHQNVCAWSLREKFATVLSGDGGEAGANAHEALFVRLVDQAGDRTMSRLIRRTSRQLRPLRRLEAMLPESDVGGLSGLGDIAAAGDAATLRSAIDRYHVDRVGLADTLARIIWSDAESIDQI